MYSVCIIISYIIIYYYCVCWFNINYNRRFNFQKMYDPLYTILADTYYVKGKLFVHFVFKNDSLIIFFCSTFNSQYFKIWNNFNEFELLSSYNTFLQVIKMRRTTNISKFFHFCERIDIDQVLIKIKQTKIIKFTHNIYFLRIN